MLCLYCISCHNNLPVFLLYTSLAIATNMIYYSLDLVLRSGLQDEDYLRKRLR